MAISLRPEVEIWPFCACAMKNMHYNSSVIVDSAMEQIRAGHGSLFVDHTQPTVNGSNQTQPKFDSTIRYTES